LIFIFGAADRIFVLWGLSYNFQLYFFRVAIWVVPAILFFVVRRACRELRGADLIEEDQELAEHAVAQREQAARAPT
jgi:hypothetical protein